MQIPKSATIYNAIRRPKLEYNLNVANINYDTMHLSYTQDTKLSDSVLELKDFLLRIKVVFVAA